MKKHRDYKVLVIGASAGGLSAFSTILPRLARDFPLPILIVQHLSDEPDSYLPKHLSLVGHLPVIEPEDKEKIKPGVIYTAPPGYHMVLDDQQTISLAFDPRVNYSRPSIDVLFKSVADAFREGVIAVILTGANTDGTLGLQKIKALGGKTIAQDPQSAEVGVMPQSAINSGCVDDILPLVDIASFINELVTS
jgi:two-component system, chemotaxis family, protein-glutamate methylesterase/glutaminase